MNVDKVQLRLAQEMTTRSDRGSALGLSEATIAEEKISVNILHRDKLEVVVEENRKKLLKDLESKFDEIQEPLINELEKVASGQTFRKSILSNSIVVDLTPLQIDAISEIGSVKMITLEAQDQVTCMNQSVDVIEVPDVWIDLRKTGRGVKVAVLDTGIDKTHPALSGKIVDEVNTTTQNGTIPPGDHATHVAGTIASNDHVYRGVAFDADLINIKVLTSSGSGQPQWVIDGIQQAVSLGAHVISLSLGWSLIFHGWVCNDADCVLCRAADTAVRMGCHMVIAAGNEDNTSQQPNVPPGLSNIRCPGNARNVITVGAFDKSKQLAPFSSRGPGTARLDPGLPIRFTKPDVAAPGVAITSSIIGGGFSSFNGTSMATPHVSGVVALMLENNLNQSPRKIKNMLKHTAQHTPYTANETGAGIVNAYTAVSHLS
jgi:serine protease AprX